MRAVRWMRQNSNTAKTTAYSRFLVQVRCILILSDDVTIINQDLRSIVWVSDVVLMGRVYYLYLFYVWQQKI